MDAAEESRRTPVTPCDEVRPSARRTSQSEAGGNSIGALLLGLSILGLPMTVVVVRWVGSLGRVCALIGYGILLTRALPFDTSQEIGALGTRYLRELPMAEYPYLIEFLTERAMKPGYSYGDEFAFGLELILDSLEQVRKAVRYSGSARRGTPDEQTRPARHVSRAR
jgi:hypothetical protein